MRKTTADSTFKGHRQVDRPTDLVQFGRNIRTVRQNLWLTLDQLAAVTGVSKPYLSNIETARLSGPPSIEKLQKLETALQLPPESLVGQADWLRTPVAVRQLLAGHGEPAPTIAAVFDNSTATPAPAAASSGQLPRTVHGAVDLDRLLARSGGNLAAPANPASSAAAIPLVRVPLINRVAAGNAAEFTDLDYPAGIADSYIAAPLPPETDSSPAAPPNGTARSSPDGGLFALRVEGDSMEPAYHSGDIVVFSSQRSAKDGDDCLVRLNDAENFSTTFKRIEFIHEDAAPNTDMPFITLIPLNPAHRRRTIRQGQITGLYPAVWRITPANIPGGRTPAAPIPDNSAADSPAAAGGRSPPEGFSMEND